MKSSLRHWLYLVLCGCEALAFCAGRGSLRLLAKGGYAGMSLASTPPRIFAGQANGAPNVGGLGVSF